jgi:hypothetical protein
MKRLDRILEEERTTHDLEQRRQAVEISELDARRAKAERETAIAAQQFQQALAPPPAHGGNLPDLSGILGTMIASLATVATENIGSAQKMMQFYMDRSQELGLKMTTPDALQPREAPPSQADLLRGALGMMVELDEFRKRMTPPPQPSQYSSPPGQDTTVMIRLKELELTHAVRLEELQDARQARQQEFELRLEELRQKQSRNDNVGNALGGLANNINELMQKGNGTQPAAQPGQTPVGAAKQQFSTITCPNPACKHPQRVQVGDPEYVCEGCGETHQVTWSFAQGG